MMKMTMLMMQESDAEVGPSRTNDSYICNYLDRQEKRHFILFYPIMISLIVSKYEDFFGILFVWRKSYLHAIAQHYLF